MWSCQLVTSVLNYFQDCFCPCNTVVVCEMYSLIGSLVIMRDREVGSLTGTIVQASQFIYRQFRHQVGLHVVQNGSCMFGMHICSLHVLLQSSATLSLILYISTCNVIFRRQDDPTNGPTGDPSMVRLP